MIANFIDMQKYKQFDILVVFEIKSCKYNNKKEI